MVAWRYGISLLIKGEFRISMDPCIIILYYINTSEIPSELSCKNFISSRMKISHYLRYCYIINRAFESNLIWYFTGVYIINRILLTYGYEFYLLVFNWISHSFAALSREISS